VHRAYQQHIVGCSFFEPVEVDDSELVYWDQVNLVAESLKNWMAIEDAVMFASAEKNAGSAWILVAESGAYDGHIGGFSSATGEEDFGEEALEYIADSLSRFVDCRLCLATFGIEAAGVAGV